VVTPVATPAVRGLITLTQPAVPLAAEEARTSASGARPRPLMRRLRGRAVRLAAAIGAVLLLTGAGAWLALRPSSDTQPPPAPATTQVAPAAPAPAAPPAQALAPALSPQATARRSPARGKPSRAPAAPAVQVEPLSAETLQSVVARAQPRFAACLKRYVATLPAGSGQVKVELAVAASGVVATAHASIPGAPAPDLAACLEREVRRLRFPRHRDREVRFAFPLVYKRD
jgi:hypothetical protein